MEFEKKLLKIKKELGDDSIVLKVFIKKDNKFEILGIKSAFENEGDTDYIS